MTEKEILQWLLGVISTLGIGGIYHIIAQAFRSAKYAHVTQGLVKSVDEMKDNMRLIKDEIADIRDLVTRHDVVIESHDEELKIIRKKCNEKH